MYIHFKLCMLITHSKHLHVKYTTALLVKEDIKTAALRRGQEPKLFLMESRKTNVEASWS